MLLEQGRGQNPLDSHNDSDAKRVSEESFLAVSRAAGVCEGVRDAEKPQVFVVVAAVAAVAAVLCCSGATLTQ